MKNTYPPAITNAVSTPKTLGCCLSIARNGGQRNASDRGASVVSTIAGNRNLRETSRVDAHKVEIVPEITNQTNSVNHDRAASVELVSTISGAKTRNTASRSLVRAPRGNGLKNGAA